MNELASLALLIADLNSQVRALQEENKALREQVADSTRATPDLT